MILGAAAGIAVPVVYHFSPWLIAVVLLGLLVVVVAQGSYRVWHDTDEERKAAIAAQDLSEGEAQAKLVEVRKTLKRVPWDPSDVETVLIQVTNGSEKRISDLVFAWRHGNSPWDAREQVAYVSPGKPTELSRKLPKGLSGDNDKNLFTADVYFRDDKKTYWCATPLEDGGNLVQRSPD